MKEYVDTTSVKVLYIKILKEYVDTTSLKVYISFRTALVTLGLLKIISKVELCEFGLASREVSEYVMCVEKCLL